MTPPDAPMTPEPTAAPCEKVAGCRYDAGHTGPCFGRFRPVRPLAAATVPREETTTPDLDAKTLSVNEVNQMFAFAFNRLNDTALRPPAPPSPAAPELGALGKVTRFEVIDHRPDMGNGRVFSAYQCRVELSYQDDGRTLKVFVDDRTPQSPACSEQGIVDFFMDRDRQ